MMSWLSFFEGRCILHVWLWFVIDFDSCTIDRKADASYERACAFVEMSTLGF